MAHDDQKLKSTFTFPICMEEMHFTQDWLAKEMNSLTEINWERTDFFRSNNIII